MILNPSGGMTYARFFPSDWRTGCMSLTLEEEGLYVRICMYMYDTGKAISDNEVTASRLLNVQIQKYRKVITSLIAKGKIFKGQGFLINERVIEEFDKWRLATATRSEAAKKREADRKMQLQRAVEEALRERATPQAPPPTTSGGTPRGTEGGTPTTPHHSPHEVNGEKTHVINNTDTTAVPELSHGRGTKPATRSQNPGEDNQLASPESGVTPALAGLNGSADPMILDIIGWMTGGDKQSAKNWLATFLNQYTQEIVRESYFALKTDLAEGKVIAQPLRVWAKIAARLKTEPKSRTAEPQMSRSEKRRLQVETAFATIAAEKEGHTS